MILYDIIHVADSYIDTKKLRGLVTGCDHALFAGSGVFYVSMASIALPTLLQRH